MKEKIEMKTYALGLSSLECYAALGNKKKKKALTDLMRMPGFVGVHPTDRVQVLLYLTPGARKAAYQAAKKAGFVSAMLILNTAYVPINNEKKDEEE